MTEPAHGPTNIASPGSHVGIQAEHVHDSTVYMVLPDSPPQKKYEVGVRFLQDGVPGQARELINKAIAEDYENAEVRFHWVLAMLSKRSYRDLTNENRDQLRLSLARLHKYPEDGWRRALEAIYELLECLDDRKRDSGFALRKIRSLDRPQREKVVRHLDLVLTGEIKNSLWAETRQAAKEARLSHDRLDRVWAYFQPEPAAARARRPTPESTTAGDWFRVIASSCLFILATGYLGWLVLRHANPLPILAYLVMLAAGCVGARNGWEWHYRLQRLAVKKHEYWRERRVYRALEGGFTSDVDESFTRYFGLYKPRDADRKQWLKETAGIRATLRDEIAEIYREKRINVGHVKWLIRYSVRDVERRWKASTLWDYQKRYRIEPVTKIWCVLSLAVAALTAVSAVVTAIETAPFSAGAATFLALITGQSATRRWLGVLSEHRRFAEEHKDYQDILQARQMEYERWKNKLDSLRPSENQMETWLSCDRTLLLDEALEHYRLAWRDVLAHAFLQTPARQCKRARVTRGPSRYSKYDIRLFLITRDGVREVGTELDFERVSENSQERNNFRFDAVSSLHVAKTGGFGYTLELTLMNGEPQNIRITDPVVVETDATAVKPDSSENAAELSKINLDAAGFTHTLHILEGIAAEGKNWIDRDPHASGNASAAALAPDAL